MNIVRNRKLQFLYCFGIAGSGKSQLARSLAKKFPYFDSVAALNTIEWHVQCKDTGDDLKEEFKKLAEELQEKGFIKKAPIKHLEEDFKKIALEFL